MTIKLMLLRVAGPLLVRVAALSGMRRSRLALVLLNRALVGLALTAVVGAVYFGIIALGRPLTSSAGLVAALVAGALFHPVRVGLQGAADRLFGIERDPYRLADRVNRRVQEAPGPAEALASAVAATRRALRAPGVSVEVVLPGGRSRRFADGEVGASPTVLPLEWQGTSMGRLLVAGEPRDRALLDMLARQLAEVAHAVRLSADLRRSRERMLLTREEERHKLRRDLYDGLGPTLTELALSADEARISLAGGPEAVDPLLTRMRRRMTEAIVEVRELVYGLRPPALDGADLGELGLEGALRTLADSPGPRVDVAVSGPLGDLPAAVEVAAYRIAHEAVAGVRRHARATTALIRVDRRPGSLCLSVADDGIGLPEQRREGAARLRHRAEELGGTYEHDTRPGGGTEVVVELPVKEPA
ncbi:histidine kinase [Nonomuraea wenchangensis]|uniref:histidine kinase n=1 Tax=Nonomuraea wenchangensis TaxID=568860 RepID=A0A1I0L1W7_9ACTN|nr:histidine kinase [Nonomuraea wenchangensis]SEU33109.1 Signal transduction histidine kinase [Nonomuraea wenchangensis]